MDAEAVGRPALELVDVTVTGEVVHTEVSDVKVTVVAGTVPVLEHATVMGEVVGSGDLVGGPSLSMPALDSWSSWSGSGVSCSGLGSM